MPMRQGEIGGSRPADSDRLLLLRELPRSRKSLRATAFRATRPQSRRWNRLRPISKGSSAMCDGAGVSWRAPAQAWFSDPAGHCHMLQFGNVPRLYQGTLADDVPEPLSGRCAAPWNAGHDTRPTRRRRACWWLTELWWSLRQVHVEAYRRLDRDGSPQARNHLGKDSPQVAMTICRGRSFAPIQWCMAPNGHAAAAPACPLLRDEQT